MRINFSQHDGSVASLEEALDREFYYRGLAAGQPLGLTAEEKAELIAFLQALTDVEFSKRNEP